VLRSFDREGGSVPLRLLLIFPFLPYPPNDGGRIGFFNPIKYLSRKHELSVVCFTTDGDREEWIEEVGRYCVELRTYKRPVWKDSDRLVRGMVLSPPGTASKYWHRGFGRLIREVVERRKPDIVEFHHLNTAIYREFAGNRPSIFREHNVEYKVWERFAEMADTFGGRGYARWTAPRVRRYEAKVAESFDRCVVVTPADAEYLSVAAPQARIEAIPSGVDTEYFYPRPEVEEEPFSITLTGSFEWKPKQQSLSVLLTEVFPRIRAKEGKAKLYVVGKGVPDELRRVAQRTPGVTVVGAVDDVRPYVWRSSLVINYLESGGGIALKVLEAMALRKAVLANVLGCEGLQVEHGREIFIVDKPQEFADAVARLLANPSLRAKLSGNAYATAMRLYSWHAIANQFQSCYAGVLREDGRRESRFELAASNGGIPRA